MENLLGPMGGVFGFGVGIGWGLGWTLAMHVVVKEARKRIVDLEASEKIKDDKIEAQNRQIQEILIGKIR